MAYAVKGRVQGYVQGVGYRFFVTRLANEKNIKGWARNMDDGSVEVFLQGNREDVNDLQHQASIGPVQSDVRSVSWVLVTDRDYEGFTIG